MVRLAWAILGLSALAGLVLFLATHPLGIFGPLVGLVLFGILVGLRRDAWLLWLPALLPVVDLAPWTGMIFFTESDALVLCTLAVFGLRQAVRPDAPAGIKGNWGFGPLSMLALALLTLSYVVSTAWLPLAGLGHDPNLLVGYDSPLNGLRLAKGFFFALLLLPLLSICFRVDPQTAQTRLTYGLVLSLALVALAALWERLAFPGLSDFSSDYRTTALFWEMHVGGAQLDGWIALSLPFLFLELMRQRSIPVLAALSALMVLVGYVCFTSFSRALYGGAALGIAVVFFRAFHKGAGLRRGSFSMPAVAGFAFVWVLSGLLLTWLFQTSGYRGMLALLGLAAAVYVAGPKLVSLSSSALALSVTMAGLAGAASLAAMGMHPKGAYLAYAASLGLFAWLTVVAKESRFSAATILAVLLWLGVNVVLVAWHWGGGDAMPPALMGTIMILSTLVLVRVRPSAVWAPGPRKAVFLLLVYGATATGVLIFNTHYAASRLGASTADFEDRRAHWLRMLALQDQDERWFGIGTGRLFERYIWAAPKGVLPGMHHIRDDDNNRFLRISGPRQEIGNSELYRVSQRLDPRLRPPLLLSLRARAPEGAGYLAISVCRKHLIYPYECEGKTLSVPAGGWQSFKVMLPNQSLGSGGILLPRFTTLSLMCPRTGKVIDVDDISVTDSRGEELVRNGDFSMGTARWFFTSDRLHLPWQAQNMWLHYLIEQGWFGLLAFTALCLIALYRVLFGRASGHPLAPALAGALIGVFVVGAIDSLVNAPRMALILFLVLFVALAIRQPRSGGRTHDNGHLRRFGTQVQPTR